MVWTWLRALSTSGWKTTIDEEGRHISRANLENGIIRTDAADMKELREWNGVLKDVGCDELQSRYCGSRWVCCGYQWTDYHQKWRQRSRKGREVLEMDQLKVTEGCKLEAKLINLPGSRWEHEMAPK